MATEVTSTVRRSRVVAAATQRIWPLLADIPGLADLIPRVRSIEPDGPDWRWTLEPVEALGFRIEPAFRVAFEPEPPTSLRFVEASTGRADHGAHGAVTLDERDDDTRIAFVIGVTLRLDIPRLLARPARAILDREMALMADGFLDELERRVT